MTQSSRVSPATSQCGVTQALQTDWIETIGGKTLRPLNPDVARGAANVAAARRLRNMVHGAVAMDPGSPDGSQRGPQDHMQEYRKRHTAQGQRAQESRGYRSDPSCSTEKEPPKSRFLILSFNEYIFANACKR